MIAVFLPNSVDTEALGARLARLLPPGCIVHLRGELGTGKTTLVRGFLRAWVTGDRCAVPPIR